LIQIFYTTFTEELASHEMTTLLNELPNPIISKIKRYRRWQDRQSVLFGKLLLLKGLRQFGLPPDCLDNLEYGRMNKPFLADAPAFNITHSGKYVLCAFNTNGLIGIDVEGIRKIDLEDFQFLYDRETYTRIRQAADVEGAFFPQGRWKWLNRRCKKHSIGK